MPSRPSTPPHPTLFDRASIGTAAAMRAALNHPEVRADLDQRNSDGDTALGVAVLAGNADVVQELLAQGANPCLGNWSTGRTPLMAAIAHRHPKVLDVLLAPPASWGPTVDIDQADGAGHTALMWAIAHDAHDAFERLIAFGADPNVSGDPKGISPLMLAVEFDRPTMVQRLLERGADASVWDTSGRTVLMAAADRGNAAVLDFLLTAPDADPTARDRRGRTALMRAIDQGPRHAAAVRTLLAHGPSALAATGDREMVTPLMMAARGGSIDVCRLLLQAGADPNMGDDTGTTALMYALANSHLGLLSVLVAAGARVDATDANGCTALHHAVFSEHVSAIPVLVDLGADPTRKNQHGKTAFTIKDTPHTTSVLRSALDRRALAAHIHPAPAPPARSAGQRPRKM